MVPGVWRKYAQRYDIYEGVCWLAREFEVPAFSQGAIARLRFGAVNYAARVFLNGIELAPHEGGYTEFVLDAKGVVSYERRRKKAFGALRSIYAGRP
jgi:beta-galactosidase/beta-glucuronidase